jgi:hypothetical protein
LCASQSDDDARGSATRIGTAEIDGLAVDHYQHTRGAGQVMNWYVRNVSTSSDEPKQLVQNAFNHSFPGQPAGVGMRDFSKQWVTPAPAGTFAIPAACAKEEVAVAPLKTQQVGGFGDGYF